MCLFLLLAFSSRSSWSSCSYSSTASGVGPATDCDPTIDTARPSACAVVVGVSASRLMCAGLSRTRRQLLGLLSPAIGRSAWFRDVFPHHARRRRSSAASRLRLRPGRRESRGPRRAELRRSCLPLEIYPVSRRRQRRSLAGSVPCDGSVAMLDVVVQRDELGTRKSVCSPRFSSFPNAIQIRRRARRGHLAGLADCDSRFIDHLTARRLAVRPILPVLARRPYSARGVLGRSLVGPATRILNIFIRVWPGTHRLVHGSFFLKSHRRRPPSSFLSAAGTRPHMGRAKKKTKIPLAIRLVSKRPWVTPIRREDGPCGGGAKKKIAAVRARCSGR